MIFEPRIVNSTKLYLISTPLHQSHTSWRGQVDSQNGEKITVHPLSSKPTAAWESLQNSQVVTSVTPTSPDTPIPPGHIRFVCISDTHGKFPVVPDGDVLIHAGDFTNYGDPTEVKSFNNYLGTFHTSSYTYLLIELLLLNHVLYRQPRHFGWVFNLPRGQCCLDKWNLIPEDTDVLVTHGPPLGHGDLCVTNVRAGCVELLSTVQRRVRPAFHVFGHIHEGSFHSLSCLNTQLSTVEHTPGEDTHARRHIFTKDSFHHQNDHFLKPIINSTATESQQTVVPPTSTPPSATTLTEPQSQYTPLSRNPTQVWQSASHEVTELTPLPLDTPAVTQAVRFVCISDTHNHTALMTHHIPHGDVLLHTGDVTSWGTVEELDRFNNFLGSLPHQYKVVIAGNHDKCLDPRFGIPAISRLTNAIYLQDSSVSLHGINIYGTPWL
ncbi:MPPED1, partial [Cordylochernes scorpioides]